jgi:hypothetical protein
MFSPVSSAVERHIDIVEAVGSKPSPGTIIGGMAERLKAPVLRTGDSQGSGGSNPSPSAILILRDTSKTLIQPALLVSQTVSQTEVAR